MPDSPTPMRARYLLGLALLAGLAACSRGAPPPEDCPRGTLDPRYCDRDGDLVADPPSDAARHVDPPQLIFAYTPVEDPSVYRQVWDGFLQHLQEVTGRRVRFFPVQSNAAQIEAMRAGRLHIAGFNTGSTPLAVNCAGFVPFAMMAAEDGRYGYEMEILARRDSGIEALEDLRGRTLAFTSPTSNSGFKAPTALLRRELGFEPERDYRVAYSGRHDNSVLGVFNRDYDAAAIANSVIRRMAERGVVDMAELRTVYRSDTFPTTSYGHAHDLAPELAEKIREAFFTFPWEGSDLEKEFEREDGFMPITYREHWSVIRAIDEASDASYACR
jgi:phosphonate transport system substrate-binding protein